MLNLFRRPIGKIWLDGKFLTSNALAGAVDKQRTQKRLMGQKELLGEVLVKMGVLTSCDVEAPLHIQSHLNCLNDAVKVAAGERQLLGALLVESGQITEAELDQAIAAQKATGERLGDVFIRLGLLTKRQLTALLDFQQNQSKPSDSPLRLGELLFATGHISRAELELALLKQAETGNKLGEILIAEGIVNSEQINSAIRLQKKLLGAVLAAVLALGISTIASARTVDLQWEPVTDSNLAGYKVYYTTDTNSFAAASVIDVQKQSAATISELDPSKTYVFAVTAYDSSGDESTYSNIVALNSQDTIPPTVAITSPANAGTVNGTVLISLNASDNLGVTKVEYYINGVLIAEETGTIKGYVWNTSALAAGTYQLMAKAYDAAGNVGESGTISVSVVKDMTAPTVALTVPANNAVVNGVITVNAGASDNVGVSKVEFYINGVLKFAGNAAPYSFTWDTKSITDGVYTITAKAYDTAGNIGTSTTTTVTVNNALDTTAPTLSAFVMPTTATSLVVPVSSFTASDNVAVTGYLITESATPPSTAATGWSATAPTSFTFSGTGFRTAYAWVKDAAGNVSASIANVTITLSDTTAPIVSTFSLAGTATSLTVPLISFSVSDNVGVAGFMITESATAPVATNAGWRTMPPASFTFSSAGTRTAYAWAKDASGNVSVAKSATVIITMSDMTAPVVSAFSLAGTATSLTVPLTSFSVSDNVGVAGFMITESATAPVPTDAGWRTMPPASFTFSSSGSRTAYAWAKDAAGNVSVGKSATVIITLSDTTAPTVSAFTLPSTTTSLTVPLVSLSAIDNVGVTGYLVTESSTKPAATAAGWSATAPTSFTFSGYGAKTAYAWAKDAAGNVSAGLSATVTINDTTAPTLSAFTLPSAASSLTVPVSSFSAGDNVGVTGYLITESATAPAATAAGWSTTAPTSFTFSGYGAKTAYAWAKDAAGNVSAGLTATLTINDTTAPTLSTFTLPSAASSLTVPVSSFSAGDNFGVTGYLISERATAPSATAAGWSATVPTSFTFSASGTRTAYAWTKDASGNVSAGKSATVTITLPDTTAPTVIKFALPSTSTSLTVPIVSLSVSDNVGITGYLITESSLPPTATAAGWLKMPPASFTFSNKGNRTAYAWAKDAVGNISATKSASVKIN